ncbi:hypothetical protein D0Z07_1276 [Hyphodiscus hymeniophilus]|uniref:Anaphase-promoting complex subunit 4 n=1 Tax=Hyphodiscus hymeniophilus TaxID=353542 RepID=A0A9P6VQS0_9HELO|nr:hypothetical protein D0Z07_1276 [Hyphodiscus hymeniophilus]
MADPLKLEVLSQKSLHQTADPELLTYCPSMDLLAVASTDQQVLIYRLNGQRVYGAAQKGSSLQVESIRWKPNGQLLAIAWSDGSVRLIGAESTKIVHQFSTGNKVTGVTCMGWASNLTSRKRNGDDSKKAPGSWGEILDETSDSWDKRSPLDLPRDLALIDIETSLPKLSVLAAGGISDDVFSSRSSLDALFRPFDPKDNDAVDVMVVGTREGQIHLTIYDSFVVGSFESPVSFDGEPCHLVLHAANEQYSTHGLLMKSSVATETLFFVPMDLRFISASSEYLSLLASRSTALQNLLRYINQVQALMTSEWIATRELPGKFLRNINETLGERGNRNIVQALYHSVATGHTFPEVREWLVDELAERGHKRWDKAVTSGLENLKRLVHQNMLPALDRCSVILSRFSGIAKFQDTNDTVGFSSQQIHHIIDIVASLHLISSKILIQVVDEVELFAAFSSWLRYEIDRLASDSSSSTNEDTNEKEASINHSKVLLYLQTVMTSSPLSVFFDDTAENPKEALPEPQPGTRIFDQVDQELQKLEHGLPYVKNLPRVDLLCHVLGQETNTVFSQIADAEKRNVLFGKPHALGIPQHGTPMAMRMGKIEDSLGSSYVAFIPQGLFMEVFRVTFSIENGISNVQNIDSTAMELGDGRVKDLRFADDNIMLVLWESKGLTSLLSIPYRAKSISLRTDDLWLKFPNHHPVTDTINPTIYENKEVLALFSKYSIPTEDSFVPEKIEIRESKARGGRLNEDNRRIVVLGKDRLKYKVFGYPSYQAQKVPNEDIPMS